MSVVRYTQANTSPAAQGAAAGTEIASLDDFQSVMVLATLTGATGGVLDVYLQSFDGTNWIDVAHFPQLAAGAAAIRYAFALQRGGTAVVPIVTGIDAETVLAANVVIPGMLAAKLRLYFEAGASTSAGAAQTLTVTGVNSR